MKILYLDESGTANNSQNDIFALGGMIVSLEQKNILETKLNLIISETRINDASNLEIHANTLMSGRGQFRHRSLEWRINFMKDCLKAASVLQLSKRILFHSKPNKAEIIQMFLKLVDNFHEELVENDEIGLVISDKMNCEFEIQSLCKDKYPNLIETPIFNDSRTSRCLQMADLLVYAEWRANQKNDTRFLFSNLYR